MTKLRPQQRLATRIAIAYGLDLVETTRIIDQKLPAISDMDVNSIISEREERQIRLTHATLPTVIISTSEAPRHLPNTLDPYGDRTDSLQKDNLASQALRVPVGMK